MKHLFILFILFFTVGNCSALKETPVEAEMPKKFTQFTFKDECKRKDALLEEIYNDMKGKATILDLMKFYSDELAKDPNINSPYFKKLQKIFDCGITPKTMSGYYHGAVIAFRNEAMLKTFDINTLNLKWPLARIFSPWTGKTFEKINAETLKAITDGFETDATLATWGANTYSSRSIKQRVTVELMRALGIKLIPAYPEEVRQYDYNIKGFFFIGKPAKTVNPDNKGRMVYQINYRWPALHTFPPDNYCIDELVQIAEGLYLGQLNYATNILKKYDPTVDPKVYKYKNFGYWMLMDSDWQKRRESISFDVIPES